MNDGRQGPSSAQMQASANLHAIDFDTFPTMAHHAFVDESKARDFLLIAVRWRTRTWLDFARQCAHC
jgi:hypothetical protein